MAGYRLDQLYEAVTVLTLTHSCVLALLLNSDPLNLFIALFYTETNSWANTYGYR